MDESDKALIICQGYRDIDLEACKEKPIEQLFITYDHEKFLTKYVELFRALESHSTLRRIVFYPHHLDNRPEKLPEILEDAFAATVASLAGQLEYLSTSYNPSDNLIQAISQCSRLGTLDVPGVLKIIEAHPSLKKTIHTIRISEIDILQINRKTEPNVNLQRLELTEHDGRLMPSNRSTKAYSWLFEDIKVYSVRIYRFYNHHAHLLVPVMYHLNQNEHLQDLDIVIPYDMMAFAFASLTGHSALTKLSISSQGTMDNIGLSYLLPVAQFISKNPRLRYLMCETNDMYDDGRMHKWDDTEIAKLCETVSSHQNLAVLHLSMAKFPIRLSPELLKMIEQNQSLIRLFLTNCNSYPAPTKIENLQDLISSIKKNKSLTALCLGGNPMETGRLKQIYSNMVRRLNWKSLAPHIAFCRACPPPFQGAIIPLLPTIINFGNVYIGPRIILNPAKVAQAKFFRRISNLF